MIAHRLMTMVRTSTAHGPVKPGEDTTLSLENGEAEPIRVIVSTMPRRVVD